MELPEHQATEDHVEEDAGEDDTGPSPAPVVVHEPLSEGREEEGSDSRAADSDASGKAPLGFEVVGDNDDTGHVHQTQPEAWSCWNVIYLKRAGALT